MDDLTQFEQEGFFAVESLNVPEYVEVEFGPFLDSYRKLNRIAWTLQYSLPKFKPANYETTRRSYCFILYARTINFVQAAVILGTKGMRVQADTQLRCAIEALFKLGALSNDRELIIDYDLAELADRIRQLKAYINYLNRRKPKNKESIKKAERSCKEHIDRLKAKRPEVFKDSKEKDALKKFSISTEKYASKADLLDIYDLYYRSGSAAVHSDSQSLEDGHFVLNSDGTVNAFKNEPHLEGLGKFIYELCAIVFDAILFVGKGLDYKIPEDELKVLDDALEACLQKT